MNIEEINKKIQQEKDSHANAINRFQNQMDAYYITIAIFLMIAILLPIGYSILINKKKDITIEDKNN